MTGDEPDADELARRSMLRRTAAVPGLALLGGVGTASDGDDTANNDAGDEERVVREIDLDTSSYGDLEAASVAFMRRGRREVVRTTIHSAHELDPPTTADEESPKRIEYSVSIDPGEGRGRLESESERKSESVLRDRDVESFDGGDVVLERTERTTAVDGVGGDGTVARSERATAAGLPEEPPFEELGDAVTYVETRSSECGPLARTNLAVGLSADAGGDGYELADSTGRFETVSGDTCDGETFGDRFPCQPVPWVYDCSIPDAFDTTWYTTASDHGRDWAEAAYYNEDFPVIPKTTADHEQETWLEGESLHVAGTVEHSGTVGFRTAIRTLLSSNSGVVVY